MKKLMLSILIALSLVVPQKSEAFWGNPADTMYLAKILMNAIQQLRQLQQVVGTARNNLRLLTTVNRGISEALNLINTIYPEAKLNAYSDWDEIQAALDKIEEIYGKVEDSKDASHQSNLDQSVAESIVMYNKLMKHSKRIDVIGENIKSQSLGASPKGAVRLSAQAAGVSLHVQNQSLRTQGAILKLQAQQSAATNKKEKDETRFFLKSARKLKSAMQKHDPQYKTPRFK